MDRCKSAMVNFPEVFRVYSGLLVALVVLLTPTAALRQYSCVQDSKTSCVVHNAALEQTNTSFLHQLPVGIELLQFRNLIAEAISRPFFKHIEPNVKWLYIINSPRLRTIIFPTNTTIQQFSVMRTSLGWIHFQKNHPLDMLSIVSCNLEQIPPSLKNLHRASYIRIQKTKIRYLDLDFLKHIDRLNILNLWNNEINEIHWTLVKGITPRSSKELTLAKNKLKTINLGVLVPLGWFGILDLASNEIETLTGRFTSSVLLRMDLSFNRLREVKFCQWTPVPSLRIISLRANELSQVPDCLQYLPNLTRIVLERNHLTSVSMDAFTGLDQLVEIDLSSNRIALITFWDYRYPKRLVNISLINNRIERSTGAGFPLRTVEIEFQTTAPRNNHPIGERTITIVNAG